MHQASRMTIGILVPPSFQLLSELVARLPKHNFHQIDFPYSDSTSPEYEKRILSKQEQRRIVEEIDSHDIVLADTNLLLPFINDIHETKWIQGTWAGVEQMVPHICKNKLPAFVFTRFGGRFGHHLVEYVIAHIINTERKTKFLYQMQDEKTWAKHVLLKDGCPYRLLSSLSITILGAGDIGCTIAKHCKQFGMKVFGMVTSIPASKNENVDEFFTSNSLSKYLEKSDYVCNVLPKTTQTDGILNGDVLSHCERRRSVFINVGRGNVVSEECLVGALRKGWLGGAVLDVFEDEPLTSASGLWTEPNVVVTPHSSGLSITSEIIETFIENLNLYETKSTLKYIVDWTRGY